MPEFHSVRQVVNLIQAALKQAPALRDVWVRGEVSDMKVASSGHWYFGIKDASSQLGCVMFHPDAMRQTIEPRKGEMILVHGRIDLYKARGDLQLYADQVQLAGGIGSLYERFELLKAALAQEGLFDAVRKQPLPLIPRHIGVVTSTDAAALRDVANVLRRRYPLVPVTVSPTLVQGAEAPPRIVQAIQRLEALPQAHRPDLVLVVRGGGSIEDLWAFNDERVVRAVAECSIPVISGVGHETDTTIIDFVADYRAPTPSAAAEVAVPSRDDLLNTLHDRRVELDRALLANIRDRRNDLRYQGQVLSAASPQGTVREMLQRLDDYTQRMNVQQARRLERAYERLYGQARALENANPEALLQRGYAIVTREGDHQPLRDAAALVAGETIRVQLANGSLSTQVLENNHTNNSNDEESASS